MSAEVVSSPMDISSDSEMNGISTPNDSGMSKYYASKISTLSAVSSSYFQVNTMDMDI